VRTTAVEGWSASTFYVPKAPGAVWSVLPSGALAVADSGIYRINVEHADGGRRIIERDAQATTMKTVPAPHIRGDQVIAVVEDDAGTIMVKRYRLILPRERDPQAGEGAPR
jgi:hypothetical protein